MRRGKGGRGRFNEEELRLSGAHLFAEKKVSLDGRRLSYELRTNAGPAGWRESNIEDSEDDGCSFTDSNIEDLEDEGCIFATLDIDRQLAAVP